MGHELRSLRLRRHDAFGKHHFKEESCSGEAGCVREAVVNEVRVPLKIEDASR